MFLAPSMAECRARAGELAVSIERLADRLRSPVSDEPAVPGQSGGGTGAWHWQTLENLNCSVG